MARSWAEFYGGAALLMVATGRADDAAFYAREAARWAGEALVEEGRS